MDGQLLTVPHFVKAPTMEGLTRAMINENMRYGVTFKYFDIQFQGRMWVAWYLRDATFKAKQDLEASLKKEG